MTENDKVLIVIPARSGSKRLPHKNKLLLAGKPLICWTIEAALGARLDARILVTSDDSEILKIARRYRSNGVVAYERATNLASDTSTTTEVLLDAINAEIKMGRNPKTLILLQPTSPLRTSEDIISALNVYQDHGRSDTVVSVCKVDHPTAWVGRISRNSRLIGVKTTKNRSQDHKDEYRLNGAVYVINVDFILKNSTLFTNEIYASVMLKERSFDIDEYLDFKICDLLLRNT